VPPLRLLHISDLHLGRTAGDDQDPVDAGRADLKAGLSKDDMARVVERETQAFIGDLMTMLRRHPEQDWPKSVIVSGDLVNRGGAEDGTDEYGEFANVCRFLEHLRDELRIGADRVLVVPGNHDVDWTPGLTQTQRFGNFLRAMHRHGYVTPTEQMGEITGVRHSLSGIVGGVECEVFLLASPLFSGTTDAANRALVERLRALVAAVPSSQRAALEDELERSRGSLDIAAIGRRQLELLARHGDRSDDDDITRLVVLHHHLLPDPQVEVAPFEAVVDAGRVLETLVSNHYDLVLSGHKHNRRLASYRQSAGSVDVYSSPSLFHSGGPASPAGYTLVDINPAGAGAYATLSYFDTRSAPLGHVTRLTRSSRILPQVLAVAADISPPVQASRVTPILRAIDRIEQWSSGHPAEDIVAGAWKHVEELAGRLAARQLEFVQGLEPWDQLLAMAAGLGPDRGRLRLVSNGRLEYWDEAIRNPLSEAGRYAGPLRDYPHAKTRILVLEDEALSPGPRSELAGRVVAFMVDQGFEVSVVESRDLDNRWDADFGLLGSLAVSNFITEDRGRRIVGMREQFGPEAVAAAERSWRQISEKIRWTSSGAGTFDEFLHDRAGHQR
jgi:3',5'-cyclic AMP phosphodiesterase CpdA